MDLSSTMFFCVDLLFVTYLCMFPHLKNEDSSFYLQSYCMDYVSQCVVCLAWLLAHILGAQ